MKNKADAYQKAIERALEKYLPLPDQKVLHASVIDAMRYSCLLYTSLRPSHSLKVLTAVIYWYCLKL